jgi:hypothetical protein
LGTFSHLLQLRNETFLEVLLFGIEFSATEVALAALLTTSNGILSLGLPCQICIRSSIVDFINSGLSSTTRAQYGALFTSDLQNFLSRGFLIVDAGDELLSEHCIGIFQ